MPATSKLISEPVEVFAHSKDKHGDPKPRRRRISKMVDPMGGTRIVSAALGGLIATALWIAMFTVGLSVPSQPFRDGLYALAGGTPPAGAFAINGTLDALYALTVIAFCYTPTNLAMLCCLAALVGSLAFSATTAPIVVPPAAAQPVDEPSADAPAHETLLVSTTNPPASSSPAAKPAPPDAVMSPIPLRPAIAAITSGFFIYLFLISGTLLAVENPFSSTTPDQYLRLAGTASLLAFVVGWKPEVISQLITQVSNTRTGQAAGSAKHAG